MYIRVSTEEQVDSFSLAAQTNMLQDYCRRENIEVYQIYADEGISGQKENRPQFQLMIKDAEANKFNLILVHKYDRFARKVELSQKVKNQLKKCGVTLISITEPLEDSPMGFFVGGLHDLMAEYYVRNLAIESKKGHIERAKQGLHNGSVPYGYRINKLTDTMDVHPEQAEIVKLIFDLYNNKGYGCTKIAIWLNDKGIPSAIGSKWAYFTVNRIIQNRKYIGMILYDGELYKGKHEPIVSEEDFHIAQNNKTDRTWARQYRGYNFDKFVLLGLLKCGNCGKAIRVIASYTRKRKLSQYYFKCNGVDHQDGCEHRKNHQTTAVEEEVFAYLKEILQNKNIDINVKSSVNYDAIYNNRKAKLENELSRAKSAYLSEVFSLAEYKVIKQKCEKELTELDLALEKSGENQRKNDVINKISNSWQQLQDAQSVSEKRKILQTYIQSILLYKDKIDIFFY